MMSLRVMSRRTETANPTTFAVWLMFLPFWSTNLRSGADYTHAPLLARLAGAFFLAAGFALGAAGVSLLGAGAFLLFADFFAPAFAAFLAPR